MHSRKSRGRKPRGRKSRGRKSRGRKSRGKKLSWVEKNPGKTAAALTAGVIATAAIKNRDQISFEHLKDVLSRIKNNGLYHTLTS